MLPLGVAGVFTILRPRCASGNRCDVSWPVIEDADAPASPKVTVRSTLVSTEAWIAWAITTAIALVALVIAILTWLRPKSAPPLPAVPPDLTLEQVGGLGSGTGSPREHIKAKLRLVNEGAGLARHWQVSILNTGDPALKIGRVARRGSVMFGEVVSWNQDATTGEIPGDQDRDLPDWLWAEATPSISEVSLGL